MEWSEKIDFERGPSEVCVVCERSETTYRLVSVAGAPPVHLTCAAKVLIAAETIRRGEPLSETHKRWLTRNRLASGVDPVARGS